MRHGMATVDAPSGAYRPSPARTGRKVRRSRRRGSANLVAYTLLSPWLVGMTVLIAVSLLYSLYLSFTS